MSDTALIVSQHIETTHTRLQYLSIDNEGGLSSSLSATQASKPIMVLLHGFPENSWTWEQYLLALADEYYVVAPDLPGYNGSEGYKDEQQYNIMQLVDTVAEFINALLQARSALGASNAQSPTKVHVAAHDWGGVIAWPLAAFNADIIHKLTILNAAHPTGFTREMANNPKQQANSDYISDLISENAYQISSQDDHRMLKRLYGGFFKKLSANQQLHYVQQWSDKHSMQQAFNYYKNMPQLHTTRVSAHTDIKLPKIHIRVPTQVLWGMKDTAFVPEVLNGMEDWVDELSLHRFDDADHWLHHQKPEEIIQKLRGFHD